MATLYFNGAVDAEWTELGNWWTDAAFTTQATGLPTSADDVIASAYISSNSGGEPTVANFTMNASGALAIAITVIGNAIFNNGAQNDGTVGGNATFNDSSQNSYGTVTGNATFNDSSYNDGTVGGNATFNDSSYNDGTVTGNATFNNSSSNYRTVTGVCLAFSFLVFLIASFAETNRLPFDLPEAETELVGGYHTEYSGMRFALFFLGEYAAMVSASAIMVTVFLGGWSLPLPWFNGQPMPEAVFGVALPGWLAGQAMPWWFGFLSVGVFLAKILFFIALFIVIRWTLPRFKYDQLMSLGWKVFIPLAFLNIFVVAALVLLRG